MSDSLVTPWTIARQVPLPMGFLRQECWSGLPFPSSGNLPSPGIQPTSHALAGRFFTTEPPEKLKMAYAFAKFPNNMRLCVMQNKMFITIAVQEQQRKLKVNGGVL